MKISKYLNQQVSLFRTLREDMILWCKQNRGTIRELVEAGFHAGSDDASNQESPRTGAENAGKSGYRKFIIDMGENMGDYPVVIVDLEGNAERLSIQFNLEKDNHHPEGCIPLPVNPADMEETLKVQHEVYGNALHYDQLEFDHIDLNALVENARLIPAIDGYEYPTDQRKEDLADIDEKYLECLDLAFSNRIDFIRNFLSERYEQFFTLLDFDIDGNKEKLIETPVEFTLMRAALDVAKTLTREYYSIPWKGILIMTEYVDGLSPDEFYERLHDEHLDKKIGKSIHRAVRQMPFFSSLEPSSEAHELMELTLKAVGLLLEEDDLNDEPALLDILVSEAAAGLTRYSEDEDFDAGHDGAAGSKHRNGVMGRRHASTSDIHEMAEQHFLASFSEVKERIESTANPVSGFPFRVLHKNAGSLFLLHENGFLEYTAEDVSRDHDLPADTDGCVTLDLPEPVGTVTLVPVKLCQLEDEIDVNELEELDDQDRWIVSPAWSAMLSQDDDLALKAINERSAEDLDVNRRGLLKGHHGITPLMVAATWYSPAVTASIMDKGADVNVVSGQEGTALLHALQKDRVENALLLIERGAHVDAEKDSDCLYTPLIVAARHGLPDVVRLLLDRNVDVNKVNRDGWSALKYAASEHHEDVVKMLLEAGADVHIEDNDGFQAIHTAIDENCHDIVRMLLDNGANVDAAVNSDGDEAGMTCLHRACFDGDTRIIHLLLDRGARLDIRNAHDLHAFDLLFTRKSIGLDDLTLETVRKFVDRGQIIRFRTILACIAGHHDKSITELLLDTAIEQLDAGEYFPDDSLDENLEQVDNDTVAEALEDAMLFEKYRHYISSAQARQAAH